MIPHNTTKNHHQKTVHFASESPVQFKPELGVQFAPEYPHVFPNPFLDQVTISSETALQKIELYQPVLPAGVLVIIALLMF